MEAIVIMIKIFSTTYVLFIEFFISSYFTKFFGKSIFIIMYFAEKNKQEKERSFSIDTFYNGICAV